MRKLKSILFERSGDTFVTVRGKCYRSQRRTSKPYRVTATVAADGAVMASSCECAAKEGLCNHVLALLRLVVLLKEQGFEEPPPEISCTELPQQWRRPRGSQIAATSVNDVDWRSVREGGSLKSVGSRLYDARKRPRDFAEMKEAMRDLGNDLCSLGDSPFAKHLRGMEALGADTTFGTVPDGSPLAYQQPLSPHGFVSYISPNIALCARHASTVKLPIWPVLFVSASVFEPPTRSLAGHELTLLQVLSP